MPRNRFDYVIWLAGFEESSYDGVTQVMEAQAGQSSLIT